MLGMLLPALHALHVVASPSAASLWDGTKSSASLTLGTLLRLGGHYFKCLVIVRCACLAPAL